MRKIFASVVVMMLVVLPSYAEIAGVAGVETPGFRAFAEGIDEAANKISWSNEYNFQDVEFVKDEMYGDERVYARAWYADYYVLIRKYTGKDWSQSYITHFWTSSEELSFARGIKVGSPINDVESYFGKKRVYSSSPGTYSVAQVEESDVG